MHISRFSLILIWSFSLALIILALIAKLSGRSAPNSFLGQVNMVITKGEQTLNSPERSFYTQTTDTGTTIDNGTPVVGNNSTSNSGKQSVSSSVPKGPVVTARAYLVGNVKTGEVYMERDSDQQLPVASMSKLVTAFAATDSLSSSTPITVTAPETTVPPDASNLQAGETFTLAELLYPLLLNSSNVAAEALASSTNRTAFIQIMSSYAWEIGMKNSYFADPSGLSEHNEATARDMFQLARYLYIYRPDILAITRLKSVTTATTTDHGAHVFANIHPFVSDPNFLGGKTGHTDAAGDTMMTILNINNAPTAFIVLGATSGERAADTNVLIGMLKNK